MLIGFYEPALFETFIATYEAKYGIPIKYVHAVVRSRYSQNGARLTPDGPSA